MELVQGVDVNFVMPCTLTGHVSKGPFQRYGVRRHLVNRARNDVLHKNNEKLFSVCPAPYLRKSATGPLQSTPHVVAWGIVIKQVYLIAPCINDSLAQSEPLFPWLGQGMCTSFKLFIRFLPKFFILRRFTTTGAGYGLFSYP